MNSILNKILRCLLAVLLCVCICFCFTACTKNTKNIKNVDQICVSGSYAESWMYVLTDEEFVNEMVEIYNSVKYEKSEEYVDMMTAGEVLSFTYSNGSENVATFIVDKNLNLAFKAGGKPYRITSEFDFNDVYSKVKGQSQKVDDSIAATPDQK
ncbi:MAG: hypothetical protein IJD68_03665 [Ruminococcus sp.]|nr:hypothetical protein [Ruminococcus sp.]